MTRLDQGMLWGLRWSWAAALVLFFFASLSFANYEDESSRGRLEIFLSKCNTHSEPVRAIAFNASAGLDLNFYCPLNPLDYLFKMDANSFAQLLKPFGNTHRSQEDSVPFAVLIYSNRDHRTVEVFREFLSAAVSFSPSIQFRFMEMEQFREFSTIVLNMFERPILFGVPEVLLIHKESILSRYFEEEGTSKVDYLLIQKFLFSNTGLYPMASDPVHFEAHHTDLISQKLELDPSAFQNTYLVWSFLLSSQLYYSTKSISLSDPLVIISLIYVFLILVHYALAK